MTEKHVNKLIPKARRIYLPKVLDMYQLTIAYIDDWGEEKKVIWSTGERYDIVAVMRDLIYQKTGIILLPKEAGKDILFSIYAKVLDTYLQNENEQLTDELREEYKQMVAIHKTI